VSVVVTAVMHPAPGRTDDVLAGIADAIGGVHAENGCELYAAHRADDGTIVLLEKWATEGDFAAHSTGAARDALRARLDGLMAAPTEVSVITAVPLGDPTKGAL
jgi:quinol monooxygenase YgiN